MKQMMGVNVISTSLCTQLSIKLMLKNGINDGHIIFNSRYVVHTYVIKLMLFKKATKHWINLCGLLIICHLFKELTNSQKYLLY